MATAVGVVSAARSGGHHGEDGVRRLNERHVADRAPTAHRGGGTVVAPTPGQGSVPSVAPPGSASSISGQVPLLPSLTLPRGGGAIRGIEEKFAVNAVTGTAGLTVPLPLPSGRSGFTPELALTYDSGNGNGPFGLGWHLSLPAITRKTDRGLPTYQDGDDCDTFLIAGAEDLVPALRRRGDTWERDVRETTFDGTAYTVQRYRPRIEGSFARIERWTRVRDRDTHWRMISRTNQITVFGRSPESRIYDPANPSRVFSWLIDEAADARGNAVRYEYRPEDRVGVDAAAPFEQHHHLGPDSLPQRYLTRVQYGNREPGHYDNWLFQIVFDYGDRAQTTPMPDDSPVPWPCRRDPFSTCRAGFEIRTYRLCRRVLVFHQIPELADRPVLVRALNFAYDDRNPAFSLLTSATETGYLDGEARSLPPLELTYTGGTVVQSSGAIDEPIRTVDAASLEHLPIGLDGARYRWVDLDGEGSAGILTEQAGAWWYTRNRGHGRFGPVELVARQPSLSALGSGRQQLTDLGGDGRTCLVQLDDPVAGYFERTPDGDWLPFRPFAQQANVEWDDPNLRFLDVTGDGLADVVVTSDDVLIVYPSQARDGFGAPLVVPKPADDDHGPALLFADAEQSIFVADLNGDGLADLVRIRNGEVCYWPSLGYGRFGPKVTMADAPQFDHPDQFQTRRLRLADVDGSSTTDLVYLGRGVATVWINQAGNSWSPGRRVPGFPAVDDLASVQVLDLLGAGTACLVWSSPLSGEADRQFRYIDLAGGEKPHLLRTISNGLGARTELAYAPSTQFAIEDRTAGTPWATRLPFPVQVVERTVTRDLLAGTTFSSRYRYRHGFYDVAEREFRGFGLVEQWDTADYAPYRGGGLFDTPLDAALDQAPVRTLTWYHTGAYEEGPLLEDRFADEYFAPGETVLPPTVQPDGLTAIEAREAARALRGLVLRREVYADDGPALSPYPYSVESNAYTVKRLQPRRADRHAVFIAHPREAVTYHFERNPADPRVAHALTLAVDDFGTATRAAVVVYPRPATPAELFPEQRRQIVTCTETDVTNGIDEADAYHAPLPWEIRTYEVTGDPVGRPHGGRLLTWAEVERATREASPREYDQDPTGGVEKRLIERQRHRYFRDDLDGLPTAPPDRVAAYALPFGTIARRPLPYESYQQAFTRGLLHRLYDGRPGERLPRSDEDALINDLLREGGYVILDGSWWIPSGRQLLDPGRFYQPIAVLDPYGGRATIEYDAHSLLVTQATDVLGNRTRATNDYRVLQPRLIVDPNENEVAATFDALGMVVATAVMGHGGSESGDRLDGVPLHPTTAALDRFLADPSAEAPALLGRATTRVVYDLDRFRREGAPTFAATISRELHVADIEDGENAPLQISLVHSCGVGRTLQTKRQAEPGLAPARGPDGRLLADRPVHVERRWVGSGRTIFNNKGNPVKQYEPFFSDSARYETERELVETGVTPVLRYDAPGRLVRTDLPDGTFTRVAFVPWRQESWDPNDTVTESRWLRERGSPDPAGPEPADPSQRAAWHATRHAGTPTVTLLDTLGRPFLTIADNGPDGQYATRTELDVEGNVRAVIDARGIRVLEQDFDMLGRVLRTRSVDAGQRWIFVDVAGQPIRSWDSRGHTLRTLYDAARRPTHISLTKAPNAEPGDPGHPERLDERLVYGEAHPAATDLNLRGRLYQQYDAAGVVTLVRYDFHGNVRLSSRRLARSYRSTPDWTALDGLATISAIDAAADALLEAVAYESRAEYDALGRPTHETAPDGSTVRPSYNRAGLLDRVDVQLRGARDSDGQPSWTPFVSNIDYDARGRRTRIVYGNGARTFSSYDRYTSRLARLQTTRDRTAFPDDCPATPLADWPGCDVQRLQYTYDAVGNVTTIRDDAQQTIYFRNRRVEPSTTYTYDAVYRLVGAIGREHLGQTGGALHPPTQPGAGDDPRARLLHPGDGQAMGRYAEQYAYDAVGNIRQLRHYTASGGWVRRYLTAPDSNRLLATSLPGDAADTHSARYAYDAHGNMARMPHLPLLRWDHDDQLSASSRQVVPTGATPETTYYSYDGGGERVRKVTERQAAVGESATRLKERIYLGALEIYREYGGNGTSVTVERETFHVMDDTRRIALVETKTIDTASPVVTPVPAIRYQLDNHLGSACLELDERANVISYEDYHPYGTTAYQAGRSAAEVSLKRYRYTGKERDEETGLAYHGARYYAPWLGRWTSADPAGLVDGVNLYEYVGGNPLGLHDPSGTQGISGWLRPNISLSSTDALGVPRSPAPARPPHIEARIRHASAQSSGGEVGGSGPPTAQQSSAAEYERFATRSAPILGFLLPRGHITPFIRPPSYRDPVLQAYASADQRAAQAAASFSQASNVAALYAFLAPLALAEVLLPAAVAGGAPTVAGGRAALSGARAASSAYAEAGRWLAANYPRATGFTMSAVASAAGGVAIGPPPAPTVLPPGTPVITVPPGSMGPYPAAAPASHVLTRLPGLLGRLGLSSPSWTNIEVRLVSGLTPSQIGPLLRHEGVHVRQYTTNPNLMYMGLRSFVPGRGVANYILERPAYMAQYGPDYHFLMPWRSMNTLSRIYLIGELGLPYVGGSAYLGYRLGGALSPPPTQQTRGWHP